MKREWLPKVERPTPEFTWVEKAIWRDAFLIWLGMVLALLLCVFMIVAMGEIGLLGPLGTANRNKPVLCSACQRSASIAQPSVAKGGD